MAVVVTNIERSFEGQEVQLFAYAYFINVAQTQAANGTAAVEQVLELPRNAVVRSPFDVVVRAGRAEWIRGKDVGQMRQKDITSEGIAKSGQKQKRTSVVIDFGLLRTVAGVAVVSTQNFRVIQVKQWTGVGFNATPVVRADNSNPTTINASTGRVTSFLPAAVEFPSEIRTERLQIDLEGSGTDDEIGDVLLVKLPDAPADLELRINDNPPVWTAPGAVIPGARGWTEDEDGLLQRTVDLSTALSALLADPTADKNDVVQLRLTLSARIPGVFLLELPPDHARTIRFLRRIELTTAQQTLDFAAEGALALPLSVPTWAKGVDTAKVTLTANFPLERTLPPIGPAPVMTLANATALPFAELMLDPDRAAAVALPGRFGLSELLGVRLPLRAEAGGVELRVLLLANVAGEPGELVAGTVSDPVLIDPPATSEDVWTTVLFPEPVPLQDDSLPLIALHITRGKAVWSLTSSIDGGELWRGPPAGPWQRLPNSGGLAQLRARFRLLGVGSRDAPVAPIQLRFTGAPATVVDATPTPKGSTFEIKPVPVFDLAGQPSVTLECISRVAGTITINDVLLTLTDA